MFFGIFVEIILNDVFIQVMLVVGEKFKNNEIYVFEVLIAVCVMKAVLEVLKLILIEIGVKLIGKVVIGIVKGDLYDIGKNLVVMMMIGVGFEVIDFGVDVVFEKFCEVVKNYSL